LAGSVAASATALGSKQRRHETRKALAPARRLVALRVGSRSVRCKQLATGAHTEERSAHARGVLLVAAVAVGW